jgi:hypothetical protein
MGEHLDNGLSEHQQALALLGGVLLTLQSAEQIVKLCMTYVFPKECNPTLEQIEAQKSEEAKKTLGYFLGQLRKRAAIDSAFDETLREFLLLRNQFIHNLNTVQGFGFDTPEEIAVVVSYTGRLFTLAREVHGVFLGAARAWQDQVGINTDLPDHEFFEHIDLVYKPLAGTLLVPKK